MDLEMMLGIAAGIILIILLYKSINFALFLAPALLVLYLIACYSVVNVGLDWPKHDEYNINLNFYGMERVIDTGEGKRSVVFIGDKTEYSLTDPKITYIYAMGDDEQAVFKKDRGLFIKNLNDLNITKLNPLRTADVFYKVKILLLVKNLVTKVEENIDVKKDVASGEKISTINESPEVKPKLVEIREYIGDDEEDEEEY